MHEVGGSTTFALDAGSGEEGASSWQVEISAPETRLADCGRGILSLRTATTSSLKKGRERAMIEEKLAALDLALPQPAKPAFDYVPVTIHCGTAYVSGQLPKVDGEVRCPGKVGAEVSAEEAAEAARICILQGLACLKATLGNLGRVERVLKVTGFVASAPGFNRQPEVIDAASRLLIDLFGEAGRHARSAIGVAELPRNAPVEIEMIVAIKGHSEDSHA